MTSATRLRVNWRDNDFLRGVPGALVERLAPLLRLERYGTNEVILREGDASDRLCLLASGRVAVHKGADAARLATLEPGAHFGEMGVLSGAPRSTTVTAETPVRLWSISLRALATFKRDTGVDLLTLSLKEQVGVLGERLTRTNAVAADSMRARMEEYRLRVEFGALFTNVIVMLFVYTSALGLLRQFSESGGSSTLTTSALLILMAAGSAWVMKRSGFAPATFGFTIERWPRVVVESVALSAVLCAVITLAKAALLLWAPRYALLPLLRPWTSADGPAATLIAYALYTLLSPVQEFIARGMLQGSLQRMLTGRYAGWRAIIVANAIFSISHQHLGLGYALAVFVPGLFWGWLYRRQGSLLGVSISHVLIGLWATGVLDLAGVVSASS
jgi:hypothetical protein